MTAFETLLRQHQRAREEAEAQRSTPEQPEGAPVTVASDDTKQTARNTTKQTDSTFIGTSWDHTTNKPSWSANSSDKTNGGARIITTINDDDNAETKETATKDKPSNPEKGEEKKPQNSGGGKRGYSTAGMVTRARSKERPLGKESTTAVGSTTAAASTSEVEPFTVVSSLESIAGSSLPPASKKGKLLLLPLHAEDHVPLHTKKRQSVSWNTKEFWNCPAPTSTEKQTRNMRVAQNLQDG